ncbi:P-loop containing nucleoside triphosphate hydrolase protein [Xylariomycetidae sp. FL2044]|nr:P-loop containing nucleoside triphosphate hydrolase protein [Xylariomycetidae sp. FL2044]
MAPTMPHHTKRSGPSIREPRGKKSSSSKAKKKESIPDKPLPVTLLSGFLGSGKTTLLQHILKSEHGLKIAVIVNDIGSINVDAALIKRSNHRLTRTEEKVVELQNGCICCTLRGDLIEELVHLADLGSFDYVVIESSGISEPQQVAESFDGSLSETMLQLGSVDDGLDEKTLKLLKRVVKAGGTEKFAYIDTTVTVIDAFTMLNDFHTEQLLSGRRSDVVPEDERTVSDLMVDQIEFANVILLNKTDMVPAEDLKTVRGLVSTLNPDAVLYETTFGKIDVTKILKTKLFNLEKAQQGQGWLMDAVKMSFMQVNGQNKLTPNPETEEYNVNKHSYHKFRPFHPQRLWELFYDKFIIRQGEDEDEQGEDTEMKDDAEAEADKDEPMGDSSGEDSNDWATEGGSQDGDEEEDEEVVEGFFDGLFDGLNPIDEPGDHDDEYKSWEPPSDQVCLANKKKHPLFARLFRSKGIIYLATRPHCTGSWQQAGAMLTVGPGEPFFVAIPEEEWGLPKEAHEEISKLVKNGGRWGDRFSQIVLIGERLDIPGLTEALDRCLLTDDEFARWEAVMEKAEKMGLSPGQIETRLNRVFADGWIEWGDDGDGDHEGHGHA